MTNTNINKAMEIINNIMPMMKELASLYSDMVIDIEFSKETRDQLYNLTSDYFNFASNLEDLQEVLENAKENEHYKEDKESIDYLEHLDDQYNEEYNNWLDDEENDDEEIFNIEFTEEQFGLFNSLTSDIPYGYRFDSNEKVFVVTVEEMWLCDIFEALDKQAYVEKYENCNRFKYEEIIELQNIIYINIDENQM